MGLIQQMKKQENMTERERDICNYILEHPELVESISSRELGHATFTSAASVTCLCQKLGVKGFPEFKMQFVREVQNGQREEKQEKVTISERENVVTIVRKATRIQQQAAMPADGHIAILISHTGENERLVEIAKMLRKNKTKVIVITSKTEGTLAP